MTVGELINRLSEYPSDMLVSMETPRNLVECMNTCFVDYDDEDFSVHEDVLVLYSE